MPNPKPLSECEWIVFVKTDFNDKDWFWYCTTNSNHGLNRLATMPQGKSFRTEKEAISDCHSFMERNGWKNYRIEG